jgi:hypothetical protein
MSDKFKMPQEAIDEILSPGYAPIEAGYKLLPDGYAIIYARNRFDNCTVEMIKWWMGSYVKDTHDYQLWHQGHGTFAWDENKRPGTAIGASHISAEKIGDRVIPMKISFFDPTEVLGVTEYPDPDLKSVTVGSVFLPKGARVCSLIQGVRKTYYGAEMRMRFYMRGLDASDCSDSLRHDLDEMDNLATFLPGLYNREQLREGARG